MKPASRRIIPSLAAIILVAFGLMTMKLFSHLARQQEKSRINREKEQIDDSLNLAQNRFDPGFLLREKLLGCVRGIEKMSPRDFPELERRIKSEFGDSAFFHIVNGKRQPVASQGFPAYSRKSLSRALSFFLDREEGRFFDLDGSKPVFLSLFRGSVHSYELDNSVNVGEAVFEKNRGMILFAALGLGKNHSAAVREFLIMKEKKSWSYLKAGGGILIFIPLEFCRDPGKIKKALSQTPDEYPFPFWAGFPEDLKTDPFFSDGISDRLLSELALRKRGVIEGGGWLCGFVKSPDPGGMLQVIVSRTHRDNLSGVLKWFPVLEVFILCVLIFGLFLRFEYSPWWSTPLAKKLAVLAFLSGMIPIFGLGWIGISGRIWERELSIGESFKELENRLSRMEDVKKQDENHLISELQEIFSVGLEESIASAARINELLSGVKKYHLSTCFYLSRKSGRTLLRRNFFERSNFEIMPETYTLTLSEQFLDSLLTLLQDCLKMWVETKGGSELQKMGISLFLETLKNSPEAFDDLQRMAMQQNLLTIGKLLKLERTMTFLKIFRDTKLIPQAICFLVFDIRYIQTERNYNAMLEEYNKNQDLPGLALMESNFENFAPLHPEQYSRNPMIEPLLFKLSQEGGAQKGTINLKGRKFFFKARQLAGMDTMVLMIIPASEETSAVLSKEESNILLGVLNLIFLVILIVWFFAKFYLAPVKEIHEGVQKMAAGDYENLLPDFSEPELRSLSVSFNRMASGLKEKEYMSRFLSDLTLEKVVKSSERLPATRLQATVLFSDIRGFTTMSETLPGESIVSMLNQHITRMVDVIESHGGKIDKYIGDAIMAVFLPLHGAQQPALRASQAGLEMMETLKKFNDERAAAGDFAIKIGVGIATGQVLMGILGRSDGRQDFTVTGPTVNSAAQMEKRTKEASRSFVVVCSETSKTLTDDFRTFKFPPRAEYPDGWEIELK